MAWVAMSSKVLFSALVVASLAVFVVSGFQHEVGGGAGWRKPTGKETETYNEWAAKNRFHVGDTVYFKYHNDSVLVVTAADYLKCKTGNPISKFDDGNTVFRFDRPGFFYFISGQPRHCKSGQRIVVRVMHPSEAEAPAPSPAYGGSDSGGSSSPGASSSSKIYVVSYVMTALASMFVLLYLLM